VVEQDAVVNVPERGDHSCRLGWSGGDVCCRRTRSRSRKAMAHPRIPQIRSVLFVTKPFSCHYCCIPIWDCALDSVSHDMSGPSLSFESSESVCNSDGMQMTSAFSRAWLNPSACPFSCAQEPGPTERLTFGRLLRSSKPLCAAQNPRCNSRLNSERFETVTVLL